MEELLKYKKTEISEYIGATCPVCGKKMIRVKTTINIDNMINMIVDDYHKNINNKKDLGENYYKILGTLISVNTGIPMLGTLLSGLYKGAKIMLNNYNEDKLGSKLKKDLEQYGDNIIHIRIICSDNICGYVTNEYIE